MAYVGLQNDWATYYLALFGHYASRILKRQKIPPQCLLSDEETSLYIARLIESGEPCMVARFGGNEVRACAESHAIAKGVKRTYSKRIRYRMPMQAGFFPDTDEAIGAFASLMKESMRCLDLLGWWGSCLQDYYLAEAMRDGLFPENLAMCNLRSLEPYSCIERPWSASLEGRRVLVVNPFVNSIRKAYANRTEIWKGTYILPEFELLTLQSVQTIAGERDERFGTWFDALRYMEHAVESIDFDVAIIGCGAYGFPLAAHIKGIGKQAIHLGGATQILFGVMGKRWESNQTVQRFYNEFWLRPTADETPNNTSVVENGCYW